MGWYMTTLPRDVLLESIYLARSGSRELLDAVYQLGEVGRIEDIPLLIRCIENPHPEVRSAAAQAMARIGGTSAITALLDALNQPDVPTRIVVILALGQTGCPEVVPVLERLTDAAEHMQIAEAASMALGLIGTPEALAASRRWMDRARQTGWHRAV
jgi:hypothetical protein